MSVDDFLDNKRYSEIFKELVDEYTETGQPVGSKTISKRLSNALSPATIRNVMAELENLGILCSEHTSSGRKPTEKGWRYFVNTFIEVSSDFQDEYARQIEQIEEGSQWKDTDSILEHISNMLSELSQCASVILTPTINDKVIQYIDFVLLSPGRALVVIIFDDGEVENRLIDIPREMSSSVLEMASRYLNTKLSGLTLSEIRDIIYDEFATQREGLDEAANDLIVKGIGMWAKNDSDNLDDRRLIVHGRSNLLSELIEISNIKTLFRKLDEKVTIKNLLDECINAHGIQVFIGSENKDFNLEGCSMIVSPYSNSKNRVIGAMGVIGPARMHYNMLINLVDCTAKLLGKLM
jgi:heat-inducible transcriptional repressor